MKKDKNSNVSIKQIFTTALFITIITFGGLNAYRIVSLETKNTILEIESANLGNKIITNMPKYETALVDNTEDDVIYSENIKFLAANTIKTPAGIDSKEANKTENSTNKENSNKNDSVNSNESNNKNTEDIGNYTDKVVSRGNYIRKQLVDDVTFDTTNNGKLLNSMLDGIKELGEKQDNIVEKIINSNVSDELKQRNSNYESKAEVTISKENNSEDANTEVDLNKESVQGEQETENVGVPTNYVRTIDVKATAYCLCKKCCGKSPSNPGYGVTASGLKIIPGTGMKVVASDPKVIPLGTKVYVEGLNGAPDYGYATVADTGSAIKNLKIDLYVETHEMALNWGIRNVRVYILDN